MEILKTVASVVLYAMYMVVYYTVMLVGVGIVGMGCGWVIDRVFNTNITGRIGQWLGYEKREPKPRRESRRERDREPETRAQTQQAEAPSNPPARWTEAQAS